MLEYLVGAVLRPVGDYLVFALGRRIIRTLSLGRVDCEDSTAIAYRRWGGVTVGRLPTMIAGVLGLFALCWIIAIVLDRHA